MTFNLNRLVEIDRNTILDEFRRVAQVIGEPVITAKAFFKHARVSRSTVHRYFPGGFRQTLREAGLGDRAATGPVTFGLKESKTMSNGEILVALRGLSDKLGKLELTANEISEHLHFSGRLLKDRFVTRAAALKAAGLTISKRAARYSDEECFENLRAVWEHYGRAPTYNEMNLAPSKIPGKPYMRFKKWNKALAAFVNDLSQDSQPDADSPIEVKEAEVPIKKVHKPREQQRSVSWRLRSKILHRDNHTCVLCGDSRRINSEMHLEIDHIRPWSKGGLTVEENLRTLCQRCNNGRSNLYAD